MKAYLPVNIQSIKAKVLHQIHSRRSKLLSSCIRGKWSSKVTRVGPASDRQKNFEVAIILLQQIELLHAPVQVGTDIVPRVAGEMLLDIRPGIRHVYLACVCVDVGKCIQHVGQFVDWELLGGEVAAVDCLYQNQLMVGMVTKGEMSLTQFTK